LLLLSLGYPGPGARNPVLISFDWLEGETVEKIRSTLERSGVEFIDENGGRPACGYESAIKRRVSTAYLRFRRQTFAIEHNER